MKFHGIDVGGGGMSGHPQTVTIVASRKKKKPIILDLDLEQARLLALDLIDVMILLTPDKPQN